MKNKTFKFKEKRDVALTVRLPSSIVKKIKLISKKYNYKKISQGLHLRNDVVVFKCRRQS